jgi:hypothetical protein
MPTKNELRPVAIVAGVGVGLGIIYLATRKKSKCKELPSIWTENDLHLSEGAQDEIFRLARRKMANQLMATGTYTLAETQAYVADNLIECDWEDRKTDKQKQVWRSIGTIVARVAEEAKSDPYAFATKYGGGATE